MSDETPVKTILDGVRVTMPALPEAPKGKQHPVNAMMYMVGGGLTVTGATAALWAWNKQSPMGAAICALATTAIGIIGIICFWMILKRSETIKIRLENEMRRIKIEFGENIPTELADVTQTIVNQVESVARKGGNSSFVSLVKRILEQTRSEVAHLDRGFVTLKGPRAVASTQDILLKATKPIFMSLAPSVTKAMDKTLGDWLRRGKQEGQLAAIIKVSRLEGIEETDAAIERIANEDGQSGIDVRQITDYEARRVAQPDSTQVNFILVEGDEIGQVYIELSDGGGQSVAAAIHFDDPTQWTAYVAARESLERNYKAWGNAGMRAAHPVNGGANGHPRTGRNDQGISSTGTGAAFIMPRTAMPQYTGPLDPTGSDGRFDSDAEHGRLDQNDNDSPGTESAIAAVGLEPPEN